MNKLCKDCKWHKGETSDMQCRAPQNIVMDHVKTTSLILGKELNESVSRFRYSYCSTHRSDGWFSAYLTGSCGPQGRWFEPNNYGKIKFEQ